MIIDIMNEVASEEKTTAGDQVIRECVDELGFESRLTLNARTDEIAERRAKSEGIFIESTVDDDFFDVLEAEAEGADGDEYYEGLEEASDEDLDEEDLEILNGEDLDEEE